MKKELKSRFIMQMGSRILVFMLATIMAINPQFSTFATTRGGEDAKKHWASETIEKWSEEGLLKGDDKGNIRPNDSITRAEFVALINRSLGLIEVSEKVKNFKDIKEGAWYAEDFAKALKAGYISGVSATEMNPLAPITNEQAFAILTRISRADGDVDLSHVKDSEKISNWAKDAIKKAIASGYVAGYKGNIKPKSETTRAQTITLLQRFRANERVFSFPGKYKVPFANKVTVLTDGVTLEGTTIDGDLIVGKGVKKITKKDVEVKGKELKQEDIDAAKAKALEEEKKAIELARAENGDLEDGVYDCIAKGYGGKMNLKIEIKNGLITKIEIVDHNETPRYLKKTKEMLDAIVKRGSLKGVDSITGATITSKGLKNAIKDGISQAKGETKEAGESEYAKVGRSHRGRRSHSVAQTIGIGFENLQNGVYDGVAEGYSGNINLKVTVQGKRVTEIKLGKHNEESKYMTPAQGVIQKMIENQSTRVDVIAGCTVTSKGIMAAVENALVKAGKTEETVELADGTWFGEGRGHYNSETFGGNKDYKFHEVEVVVEDGKVKSITRKQFGDDNRFNDYIANTNGNGYELMNQYILEHNTVVGIRQIFAEGIERKYGEIRHKRDDETDEEYDAYLASKEKGESGIPMYDAVSGATNSSRGYVAAVENALERSAKYKKDKIEQKIKKVRVHNFIKPFVHPAQIEYGRPADFKDWIKADVYYYDGTDEVVDFEDFEAKGLKFNYPSDFVATPEGGIYSEPSYLKIRIEDPISTSKQEYSIRVARGKEYIDIEKVKVFSDEDATNELAEFMMPHDEFNTSVDVKFAHDKIKAVKAYDNEGNERAVESFKFVKIHNLFELQVEMAPIPALDTDTFARFYRYASLQFDLNKVFDEANIDHMEIVGKPVTTEYNVGDNLDLAGLSVKFVDISGVESETIFRTAIVNGEKGLSLDVTDGEVLNQAGTKTITISKTGLADVSFDVTVNEVTAPEVAKIKIKLDGTILKEIDASTGGESHEFNVELSQAYESRVQDLQFELVDSENNVLEGSHGEYVNYGAHVIMLLKDENGTMDEDADLFGTMMITFADVQATGEPKKVRFYDLRNGRTLVKEETLAESGATPMEISADLYNLGSGLANAENFSWVLVDENDVEFELHEAPSFSWTANKMLVYRKGSDAFKLVKLSAE